MSAEPDRGESQAQAPSALLALYDEALPVVYGYFVRRCGDRGTAEDLTSETFLAAMDAELDRIVAEGVLGRLLEQHRTVLALRYLDGCSVPECAELIGRTVHATEALLVRARRAFRAHYPDPEGGTS